MLQIATHDVDPAVMEESFMDWYHKVLPVTGHGYQLWIGPPQFGFGKVTAMIQCVMPHWGMDTSMNI